MRAVVLLEVRQSRCQKDCFVVVKKGVRLAIGNGPISMFFDVADDFTASVFEAIENVFG